MGNVEIIGKQICWLTAYLKMKINTKKLDYFILGDLVKLMRKHAHHVLLNIQG